MVHQLIEEQDINIEIAKIKVEECLIEEQDINIKIAKIKVEECYNWVDDLVLGYFKNCYEEYEPVRWIEAKVNLKPVENVCKCKKNMVITRGMASKHEKFCYLLYN